MQTEKEFSGMVEDIVREAIDFGKYRIFPDMYDLENKKVEELVGRITKLFNERFNSYSSYTFGD